MAITRRELIGSAVAARLALGQGQIHYRDYSRCLPDYLSSIVEETYRRRNARIAKLTTAASIREYQAWARSTFLKIIGGLPDRNPLNTRVTGTLDHGTYKVEKLVYESQPSFPVTASLYVPSTGRPPYPGVLVQMGHSPLGKSYPLYQRFCQALAQLQYVVLAFDPFGQGERTNYPQPGGWLTRLQSADEEHTMAGRQMLLVGDTATRFMVWDAVRSLDVLAADPRVDPRRLASTGQSGGATLTMLLAAVDDRLAAAAVSCGNTENFATVPFRPPGSTDDAEQDFIASAPLLFDRWDTLWPFAPKPLLIAGSARDFAGVYSPSYLESGREEFHKLERAYATSAAQNRIRWFETPLPHALSYAMRMELYNWFNSHLRDGAPRVSQEPPTNPDRSESLWCGPSGNVVRDFGGRTVFALTGARAREIRTPDGPVDLRALLNIAELPVKPSLEVIARSGFASADVLAVEVKTAEKVWVPGWLYLPKRPWTRLMIVLDPAGRNSDWGEDGIWARLASEGTAVCEADVRGVGDLEPGFGAGAPGYVREHQSEENYAWASLILGRSLLGQRVTDIVTVVRALTAAHPSARLTLSARGKMTVAALCASAMESRIAAVFLCDGLPSWRSIVESETYSEPLANFVPDVLRTTDLPQIARAMAPRPVIQSSKWTFDAFSGFIASI